MNHTIEKHGISISIDRINERFYLMIKVVGKLTHEDYETINPMLDSALQNVKAPKVKVYIDATEMRGWEPRAAWDDLKLGLKHNNQFEKIAVVGDQKWLSIITNIGNWFTAAEVKCFDSRELAMTWLFE